MATSKYFKGATSTRKASRQSPPPEDSPHHHTSSEAEDLLTEISKMNTTLRGVASDVSKIKETTSELKSSVKAIQERLEETESRVSAVEDAAVQRTSDGEKHGKTIDMLRKRVEDLENRSRRNNVRLVGLKEGREGGGGLVKYIQGVLAEGLGMELDSELEIEGAHRALIPRPSEDRPPRMVLIRFLRSAAREKVLRAAREKGPLDWEGCKLSFFPDMSSDLAEKRKTFITAIKLLRGKDVRYALVYPATLKFNWKGQSQSFQVSSEAEDFIRQQIHPSVRKRGQQPEPQRCTKVLGSNLFQCPFCSLSKFKATKPYKVQHHLAWHARGAVEYGDYTMYRCGFECRPKFHFHCPGCTTTIIRKEDFHRHFGICKHSRFFKTTSNNSTPTLAPPAAISISTVEPPATDPTPTAAPPATDPTPSPVPPATDPTPSPAPPATDPTPSPAPPATDPTPSPAPPATDPTPSPAPPPHLPSVEPCTNTSVEMKLKEIRVRNIIQVNCPYCDLLLNKKNLKTHIQRKHTKPEVMDTTVSSNLQSMPSESS